MDLQLLRSTLHIPVEKELSSKRQPPSTVLCDNCDEIVNLALDGRTACRSQWNASDLLFACTLGTSLTIRCYVLGASGVREPLSLHVQNNESAIPHRKPTEK